ncbi:GGDEF domain-containing protein [Butyrivibrio sp. VCD2006]|uniref:GGDEF domain-containing protein n=1 Tax=Butyrivibrio sp. VCD2006 TaxID=1280664 RepID=UPI00040C5E14|nr:GGDEF domain-containing protein [Butyrivibrio sp. VCD2006]
MENKALEDYTEEDLLRLLNENVDAIVMVDAKLNEYRTITRKNIFKEFIDETGSYEDLIQKLWFHLGNSSEEISEDYKAFTSYYGQFKGKYSRRLNIFLEGSDTPHIIQMNVYPIKGTDKYVFAMDELDDDEYVEQFMTTKKVNTIQNTYLFSMFVDLIQDTTSSISVTEISEDTVYSNIKYSQWRLMAVNMIWPEDQKHFLKITDPEYLKEKLAPGRTTSFDCMMKNLEGVFIWVKLIFSRAQTGSDDDFRFVFMVQNINDNVMDMMSTLKKYEGLALKDPLTGLFNHGGIKTEILNAIDIFKKGGDSVALLMIDLDNFKTINDSYGHAIGDEALKDFSGILNSSVSGKMASVGRWGGEEFVIVLKGHSIDEAYDFAEELREKVEEADFGDAGHITCSIGLSQLKADDEFDDFFNRVDKAMYASKEAGRNKVTKA